MGISIHALREEGDSLPLYAFLRRFKFLSTPSVRRATEHIQKCKSVGIISIHALREEGDIGYRFNSCQKRRISIHALREEGDSKNGELLRRFCLIIHDSEQF